MVAPEPAAAPGILAPPCTSQSWLDGIAGKKTRVPTSPSRPQRKDEPAAGMGRTRGPKPTNPARRAESAGRFHPGAGTYPGDGAGTRRPPRCHDVLRSRLFGRLGIAAPKPKVFIRVPVKASGPEEAQPSHAASETGRQREKTNARTPGVSAALQGLFV